MASALQKLFRKRISKQQVQEQRLKQEAEAKAEAEAARKLTSPQRETQPYLTVSSLNSPSASSLHFPFSSKVSLNSYQTLIAEDGSSTASPQKPGDFLVRMESNSSYHRPRAASLSATSMIRGLSDSSETRRTSAYHDTEALTDQFGALIEGNADREGLSSAEEEGLDENPLYAALTHRSNLQQDWNMAKLVLIPSKVRKIRQEDIDSDNYIALHALLPSNLFKDQYVSVRSTQPSSAENEVCDQWSGLRMTANLEPESKAVRIVITKPAVSSGDGACLQHTVNVVSETTVYRSLSIQEVGHASTPATQGQKRNRRERIRIRVLTVEGPVISDDVLLRLQMTDAQTSEQHGDLIRIGSEQSFQAHLERRQAQPPSEAIAFPQTSPTLESAASSPQLILSALPNVDNDNLGICVISSRRQFLADFAFLLDPPREAQLLQAPLHATLDTIIRAASEFTSAYVYVPGFDAYNVSRIRRGILSRAWHAFENGLEEGDDIAILGADGRSRLLLLLENVVMGYCHGKLYSSIRGVYRKADEAVDNVICTYQELQVSLEDLRVGFSAICRRPALLDRAIYIAKHLGDADEDVEHILSDCNVSLIQSLARQGDLTLSNTEDIIYHTSEKNRGRIRTPLDVLDVLQATLEEIGSALERASKSGLDKKGTLRGSLGTDELLPILAYVLIRAGPMKLVSMLYYARQFGLSDATSSQANWALVTHNAVIEYIRKDPLRLCSAKSPTYSSSVHPSNSQSTLFNSPIPKSAALMDRNAISSSSSDAWKRDRRCSLPSSILLSSIQSELSESTLPSCVSSELPASDSVQEGEGDQDSSEDGFKVPGRPASAYAVASRCKVLSALDVVGEDGLARLSSSSRPSPSFARPASSLSRRTTSMSGSGDLHIRPQIVVRPSKNSGRSPTTSTGSKDRVLMSDILASREAPTKNLDRTLSLGSKMMSRTGSEEPPSRRFESNTSAVSMPLHSRRKSLDSWASFSFFGSGTVLSTPKGGGTTSTSTTEVSPSNSSQGYPTTPTSLASSPTMWLSSWTTDWAQRRKDSLPTTDQCMGSEAGSRPGSITSSNEDSMTPLATHSFSSCTSNHLRSEDLQLPERRRRRPAIRTRFLSMSTPTEPLPPKINSDTATGDYFHREHAFGEISPTFTYTSLGASVRLHSALAPSTDQQTPRQLDSIQIPPPSIVKLHIPTPVEESNDPINSFQG